MSKIGGLSIVDFQGCSIAQENCSEANRLETGKELLKAFSQDGFAYLTNCGITDDYVNQIQKSTESFFTSSESDKRRYKKQGPANFGYFGIGSEAPDPDIPADFKEAFNVSGLISDVAESQWPHDIAPDFKASMLEFMEKTRGLALRIFNALCLAMDLKDEHFFEKCHSDMHTANSITTGRTLYYPPVAEKDLVPGQVRLGKHVDATSMTIYFQDSVGGLQIEDPSGKFIDVTPVAETALVGIGKMLDIWTCGKLKSMKHRVVTPPSDERSQKVRRSLIYFALPNNDVGVNRPLVYKDGSTNREMPDKIMTSMDVYMRLSQKAWDPNDA